MSAQIPGFQWLPASTTHFSWGRTEKVRGGAQHYTAGTDSRAWLTHSSRPPVSATFLIRKNATMDFRGWQLVRIEDTAWTTAFSNPYTVSIEYEHLEAQAIPDGDYDVMAQTWVDIAAYVSQRGLGEIPLNRNGLRGHREWVGGDTVCPDGIDMDYLVEKIGRRHGENQEPAPRTRYFSQTGHNLSHGFKGFWESRDNPAEDGFPLSEEFGFETDGGEVVTSQCFERASYEYRPDIADNPHGVVLGAFSSELIDEIRERYPDAFETRPAPGSAEVPKVSLDSWIPVRDPNDVGVEPLLAVCRAHGRQPQYDDAAIRRIGESIVSRSREFGFRTSICMGQMLHETGFFQYGGQVRPEQNNFAGLGATNDGAVGATFPNEDEGVLAVMCHLALYVYGDIPDWPEHLRQYSEKAIRRDAVRWAHQNTRKPDGALLGYLGAVKLIGDFLNGRWAQTDSVPLGTLDNGYGRSLVRVTNEVIAAANASG